MLHEDVRQPCLCHGHAADLDQRGRTERTAISMPGGAVRVAVAVVRKFQRLPNTNGSLAETLSMSVTAVRGVRKTSGSKLYIRRGHHVSS
jgi:hypothetical protein